METANARVPTAKYTKMGETLRHVIPGHMQCSMACGGKACKYENPSRWRDEEQAIKGLYSSWITDSLLAMARPSTEIIEKYGIIEQFKRCGLKTVINLQRPGEHASCGNPLEPESGFTYRPETFMQAGVYYYNFGWKDYGVASLTTILDMVKVMSFAVQEGKMAVHCHAGLGRTGVLLACYLVFTARMNADQAILFVRAKRPNSIQTRGQLLCVREFAQFLVPLRSVFSCAEPKASAVTLSQYLTRQRHLLHGYEARRMKNVPKIVHLVCKLLLDIAANRQVVVEEERLEIPDLTAEVEKTVSQQALQQLGREMRGKGIPLPACALNTLNPFALQSRADQPLASDNELDPLWRQQNLESPLSSPLWSSRSLSDSVLHKLGEWQQSFGNLKNSKAALSYIKRSLSHGSLESCSPLDVQPQYGTLEPRVTVEQDFLSEKTLQKRHQSLIFDPLELRPLRDPTPHDALPTSKKSAGDQEETNGRVTMEFPSISVQAELPAENRRLWVAQALALIPTDWEFSPQVQMWQTELNSREGAWERLCTERDPLVLSGLMWSWLEQLKDPIISTEDMKSLAETRGNPQSALHRLQKGPRLTLLCVLDCAAQLLPLPEDLKARLLTQTVKVFTKTDPASGVQSSLTTVLSALLHDLPQKSCTAE
uniref:Protein tyrosine phosphatase domain-containing protein 1 n=1 Tax=Oryzias latipes TaxID=8090 RepID=A0A3P9LI98_ORYLA